MFAVISKSLVPILRLFFILCLYGQFFPNGLAAVPPQVTPRGVDSHILAENYLDLVSYPNDPDQVNILMPLDPLVRGFTLLGVGSRGKTQEQILKLFGTDSADELYKFYKKGEYGKTSDQKGVKFLNAISWETHRPYPKFLDFSFKNLSIPFLPGNYDSLNNWVVQETNRKLSDIIPSYPLGSSYVMYLLGYYNPSIFSSPVYIDSESFFLDSGTSLSVDFFRFSTNLHYVSDQYAQTVFFKGNSGSELIAFILPNKGLSSEQAHRLFSPQYFLELFENYNVSSTRALDISIPKVSFVSKGSLKKALQYQGVTFGFDNAKASFPLISSGDLYFSDVLYNFKLSLIPPESLLESSLKPTQKGSVFTPLKVIFNRPFYVVAIDTKTGLPYIFSKVGNPQE